MDGAEIPKNWRQKKQRLNLEGVICEKCDNKIFPPTILCRNCGSQVKAEYSFLNITEEKMAEIRDEQEKIKR